MAFELFEAFTGLAGLLAISILTALFVCVREIESDPPREWTMRPRRRGAR